MANYEVTPQDGQKATIAIVIIIIIIITTTTTTTTTNHYYLLQLGFHPVAVVLH
jgi:hypothetical protein